MAAEAKGRNFVWCAAKISQRNRSAGILWHSSTPDGYLGSVVLSSACDPEEISGRENCESQSTLRRERR
jgi:hypothetical protein